LVSRYAGWSLAIPEEFAAYAREHTFRRHWYTDFVKGFAGESVLKRKERVAAQQ
jgi:hypothetical protein